MSEIWFCHHCGATFADNHKSISVEIPTHTQVNAGHVVRRESPHPTVAEALRRASSAPGRSP